VFPEFAKFALAENLSGKKLTGSLDAKLPRILGQGKTKAVGLDLPPAPIERKQEFITLELPPSFKTPVSVREEQARVREEVEKELKQLCSEEGARSLASNVIRSLSVELQGLKNNYFYAGRFLLIPDKKRTSWSWSITPHYPIIDKIPPDFEYLVKAFTAAEEKMEEMVIVPEQFEKKLELSWLLARHSSEASDKVLLSDVARMYVIAAQENKFWSRPQKKYFNDVPDASFIANLINYKRNYRGGDGPEFEFMPATLNDSYRKDVYHIPLDREGTQTRPYVYIVKRR
jgi:hypothetical protein